MKLTLATRGSPLARAQSAWVGKRLEELHPGLKVDFLFLKTSGDRFSLDRPEAPPEAAAASNVKAMFVKEIAEALLRGEADFGVHSAK
ncbi:MAG: hydroxymethylbilane synthase, partial [Elusimicrobiota bacterium]